MHTHATAAPGNAPGGSRSSTAGVNGCKRSTKCAPGATSGNCRYVLYADDDENGCKGVLVEQSGKRILICAAKVTQCPR